MRHLSAKFCLFIACVLSLAAPVQAAVTIGQQAPAFTLQDSNNQSRSLSDFAGKTVVLEWTNHGCPFVKKHYKSNNMQNLQKQYTAKDVVWLSIISSAAGKQGHVSGTEANELSQSRQAAPTAVLLDTTGSVGKLYGARTTPHMYIIDTQGTLRYAGAIDSINSANPKDISKAKNYVSNALDALLDGKPIAETRTSPYGCSVKY